MAAQNTDSPATFNWTDEEKALLRRTLRVRVLEEERLEVETVEPVWYESFVSIASTLMLLGAAAGVAFAAAATLNVGSRGIAVSPAILFMVPFINMLLMFVVPGLRSDPSYPVSFCPETAWFIWHRQVQGSLGMLRRSQPDTPRRFARAIELDTDVATIRLHTRISASGLDKRRAQQLLLTRCSPREEGLAELPARIVRLVGHEVASLPRSFYVPLFRYTSVISVTQDMLVVRGRATPYLHFLPWAVLIGEAVLGTLGAGFEMFRILPDGIVLGDISQRYWPFLVFTTLLVIGLLHAVLVDSYERRCDRRSITFSKHLPHLIFADHLGETLIPTRECTLSAELDHFHGEEYGPIPTSISIQHGKRRLAKWVLDYPQPSESETRALERGLRDYLRCADRLPPRGQLGQDT